MRIALIFLLTVLFGCASTPEPKEVPLPRPTAMDFVQSVTGNCMRIHGLFNTGESPVDCTFRYPKNMTLSFPSSNFHDEYVGIVGKFYRNWCRSVTRVTGAPPRFIRIFRREQSQEAMSCDAALRGTSL